VSTSVLLVSSCLFLFVLSFVIGQGLSSEVQVLLLGSRLSGCICAIVL
jgi:hypothetical protein